LLPLTEVSSMYVGPHLAKAVGHEVKRAIWRNERDGAIILKTSKPHTLVKLDIFKLDCLQGNVGQATHMRAFTKILSCAEPGPASCHRCLGRGLGKGLKEQRMRAEGCSKADEEHTVE